MPSDAEQGPGRLLATDPVAAALAVGKTPAPEVVAASRLKKAFTGRTAVLCFMATVASLACCTTFWVRTAPRPVVSGRADNLLFLDWLVAHPVWLGVAALALLAAAAAAWRNVRLRRSHVRSWRLSAVFFGLLTLQGILLRMPLKGTLWAAILVGAFWTLYIAVEPYIRRTFPAALISWFRAVDGSWRDSLAASHILGGITARTLSLPAVLLAGIHPMTSPGTELRLTIAHTLGSIVAGSASGLITISSLLVLRRTIRRKAWPTVVMIVLGGLAAPRTPAGFFIGALNAGIGIWLVNRFGWLALLAGNIALQVFLWMPLDVGLARLFLHLAVFAAASGWALYCVLRAE